MIRLALVLEFHHPLPGPGERAGADWAPAAIEVYWPILRALSRFAESQSGASLTLAISPSWVALASDPDAQSSVALELHRRESEGRNRPGLHQFVIDRCGGDAVTLVRQLGESSVVDLIPTTSSHTWLPSVAHDPGIARAQVNLAAADLASRTGRRPSGIWLPFLGYRPGLESTLGEAGLRFFGVAGNDFLRGTTLPPHHLFAPMITPPGVAVFGLDPEPMVRIVDPSSGYGRDPRYLDPAASTRAAARHAEDFLESWLRLPEKSLSESNDAAEPVSVLSLTAHDLLRYWPGGKGVDWLEQVLMRLPALEGGTATSLSGYLERYPSGVVGRPGPSAGEFLSARSGDPDLFDRCRVAADLLAFALEHRRQANLLQQRTLAHMTRCLLRAQQVDWLLPPDLAVDPATAWKQALAHLDCFHTLAGLLMAGRPDPQLLDDLDRGPRYLPEIDLNLLGSP